MQKSLFAECFFEIHPREEPDPYLGKSLGISAQMLGQCSNDCARQVLAQLCAERFQRFQQVGIKLGEYRAALGCFDGDITQKPVTLPHQIPLLDQFGVELTIRLVELSAGDVYQRLSLFDGKQLVLAMVRSQNTHITGTNCRTVNLYRCRAAGPR